MISFSSKKRNYFLDKLEVNKFDVLIIGGGITGAGIFLDAQSRGLSCCLIEMQDFSEGTSSRSTRLIHGGLRYLKQLNFKLVKDTGRERNVIHHIACHLTYPKQVIVTAIKGGNFPQTQLRLALWVYEKLAKVPLRYRHTNYSVKSLLELIPFIKKNNLRGGVEYTEFQTNDARLTIENIKKSVELGGIAVSQLKVIDLVKNKKGKITGVIAKDMITRLDINIQSACIISATGAWTDNLIKKTNHTITNRIQPSKGIHLVFKKDRFPISKAIYFDTPDKRMIFAIPETDCVYVGTTDTFFDENISDPQITNSDINYLLDACNNMFTETNLLRKDIISGWVGVRPLIFEEGKKPSEISRKHEIFTDKSGLISIAGGKLTGYRKMAEKVTDVAIKKFFKSIILKPCNTENIKLCGSDFETQEIFIQKREEFIGNAIQSNWTKSEALWVYKHFGSQSEQVLSYLIPIITTDLPNYLCKTLFYVIDNEMILNSADFFIRRTNLLYFYPEIVEKYYLEVSRLIADYLNYTDDMREESIKKITRALSNIKELKTPV